MLEDVAGGGRGLGGMLGGLAGTAPIATATLVAAVWPMADR